MTTDRFAVIADIHGNRWALDAVLADIDRRQIATIVDLGDSVYGPLDPAGTAARLMARDIPSICGNQDRIVLDATLPATPLLTFVKESLTSTQLQWIAALPATAARDEEIFLCHGTPTSDETYLLEAPTPSGGVLRLPQEIVATLGAVNSPVVLCGHSHVPRVVTLPNSTLIVNPGSVGMPAYDADAPVPHIMEVGSPHARYAVLTRLSAGWSVEQIAVPYDWEEAARVARDHARDDWAGVLLTGRATRP